jgi:SagB-type dehydrogenase family enzyme
MYQKNWQKILLSPGDEDQVWELFHENSKLNRFSPRMPDETVRERAGRLHEALPFEGYPVTSLPRPATKLPSTLQRAILTRTSVREMIPCTVSMQKLSTLLHYGYGKTRENSGSPRALRTVPSAGALFPLEIFLYNANVRALSRGLYHYNPVMHHLRMLRQGNEIQTIAQALIQPDIALNASLILFLTAIFERTVFKYGDRGYRFIFIEAGHVAQNINLGAKALGLDSVNIGGFFDREIDDFLDLDGVTHSTIYMIAAGKEKTCKKSVSGEGRIEHGRHESSRQRRDKR